MRAFALALGLAVTVGVVAEHDALATPPSTPCTVTLVESMSALNENPSQGEALVVQCSETPGISYWMYVTTGASASQCRTINPDLVKMTESVAASMRLSGKTGVMYYNNAVSPCGQKLIEGLSF